jgi:hypothetical protein
MENGKFCAITHTRQLIFCDPMIRFFCGLLQASSISFSHITNDRLRFAGHFFYYSYRLCFTLRSTKVDKKSVDMICSGYFHLNSAMIEHIREAIIDDAVI